MSTFSARCSTFLDQSLPFQNYMHCMTRFTEAASTSDEYEDDDDDIDGNKVEDDKASS